MNRIDEIFIKYRPNKQMDDDESKLLLNILLSKDSQLSTDINELDKDSEIYKHFQPLLYAFQVRVFMSKIEHLTTLRITLGALIVISMYIDSPGIATMYAYYLHSKLPANTLVTLEHITTQLFPWGFFSNEQLNKIWDEQKTKKGETKGLTLVGAQDNLLDYKEMWGK